MKKLTVSFLIIIIACVLLLPLSGCIKYASNYKAIAMVQMNTSKKASVTFSSLEGTLVFKLKCRNSDEQIRYSAKIETGDVKVYYDANGTKTELCTINSGEEKTESAGVLQKGTVYIIIETTDVAKDGAFSFEID